MLLARFLAVLAALAIFTAGAASTADRSPFAQGHWWDPTRPGSGFEVFNAADQVAVVWFTYDEAGNPVWYTAQGELAGLGKETWPLWLQRWNNGRTGTIVGSLRLEVNHPESMSVSWQLGGKQGTAAIKPFTLSGIVNDVDHTGSWFDPSNSGWGLSVTEQGDVFGGVLFTYDASGAATWVAGFDHGTMAPEYFACKGSCPWCAYRSITTRSVGRLSFAFTGDWKAVVRGNLGLTMAPGIRIDSAELFQLSRTASSRPADKQLAGFHSDAALKAYLDAGMLNVPASGMADFSAPPPAAAFSTTNVQEAGVDEPDAMKSDGQYIYTYAPATSNAPVVRIARVGGEGATLDIRGSVTLLGKPDITASNRGLFLDATNLVSIIGTRATPYPGAWMIPIAWTRGVTHVEILDTSDPEHPVTRWRAQIDGHVLASRRIGQKVYLVTRFVPYLTNFIYGTSYPSQVDANRQILARTPLAALLPQVSIDGATAVPAVAAANVYSPPQGEISPLADMIVVTVIDLGGPRIAQTLAIIGPADAFYASTSNLYVASSRYRLRTASGLPLPSEPPFYLTDIHQLRLGAGGLAVVGSGTIEGFLGYDSDKTPFRLSESGGRLRVVSSSSQMWGTQNRLTILEPSTVTAGVLRTVSYLPNAQRPESLGKPAEFLYSTRFLDDRLYAVTFRKVDPLYVVDLANAADPKIAGTLELPGFSDYLHPLPGGLLLGFGKDAVPANVMGDGQFAWYQGLQLTLFDVSDASRPRELQHVTVGKRGSDSALLREHHAFSMLMRSDGGGMLAVPAAVHDGPAPISGSGDSAMYPWQQSALLRFDLQRGASASSARLVPQPSLVLQTAPQNYSSWNDSTTGGGRSILFRNGTVYVGNGSFWRQDSAGSVSGPY